MEEELEIALMMEAGDDNVELLLLHNIIGVVNDAPNNEGIPFDLNNYSDEEVKTNFRFSRNDIVRLRNAVRVPEYIVTETRNRTDGLSLLIRY